MKITYFFGANDFINLESDKYHLSYAIDRNDPAKSLRDQAAEMREKAARLLSRADLLESAADQI
jgi:hypothetical protein